MSVDATPITPEVQRYITAHAPQEDAFLAALRAAADDAGLPRIHVAPEQAAFLGILLAAAGARRVLEIGTLGGYSAIAMARALPESGRVDTLEVDEDRAAFARDWIARSDVPERVRVHVGDALERLPALDDDVYDAAFIDADKERYEEYLEHCLRLVRVGGLILADNALAFGQLLDDEPEDPGVVPLRAFNERIAAEPRLRAFLVPVGDGCWVAVRLR